MMGDWSHGFDQGSGPFLHHEESNGAQNNDHFSASSGALSDEFHLNLTQQPFTNFNNVSIEQQPYPSPPDPAIQYQNRGYSSMDQQPLANGFGADANLPYQPGTQMVAGKFHANSGQQSQMPAGQIMMQPMQQYGMTPAWNNMSPGQQNNFQGFIEGMNIPHHQSNANQGPYGLGRMHQQHAQPVVTGAENGQQRSASDASASQPPVPLPPQNASQSPAGPTGPMSTNVTIPPRPRPGRKPIPQEDAADRRRMQNRNAQRNFRDKRQQKLVDTLRQLEENKRKYESDVVDFERKIDEIRRSHAKHVEDLNRKWTERLQEMQRLHDEMKEHIQKYEQRDSLVGGNGLSGRPFNGLPLNTNAANQGIFASAPTPPEDYAMDFTSWRSGRPQPTVHNDSLNAMDFTQQHAEDCGFCAAGSGFCPCKDANVVQTTVSQPGTCDMCQRDPERAKACRELAEGSQMQSRPSSSTGGEQGVSPMSMQPPAKLSCSTMVDMVRKAGNTARGMAISDIMGPETQTYPRADGGYDIGVDEQEAASALQSLSRRNTVTGQ